MEKVVMTIAGSDSGGGAGIQADLKAFAALGVHGTCAITSITAQNTLGVQRTYDIPTDVIADQIEAILSDFDVAYAKTGMLSSSEIIRVVAQEIKKHKIPVVVDPVMVAEAGGSLLREDAVSVLIKELIPLAKVITPNIFEAEALSGVRVKDRESAKLAARKIHDRGADCVLITGGHLGGVDILYDGEFTLIPGTLVKKGTHGAGCTHSAALTAYMARGFALRDAAIGAKEFVTAAIAGGADVGGGANPVDAMAAPRRDAERYRVMKNVKDAVSILEKCESFPALIPEVGTNIGMALSGATSAEDVAAVRGRIVRVDGAMAVGNVDFGASRHVAQVILATMKFDENMRSAMNILYSPDILSACKKLGFAIASFDRKDEPKDVSTMEWGTRSAIEKFGAVPDVIYDLGAVGKEAMVRILGRAAIDVAKKATNVANAMRKG